MVQSLCVACGTQFAASESAPESCPICTDARQFVPSGGQRWTTLGALRSDGGYQTAFHEYERGLIGIGTTPTFAIGQRALLLRTAGGNVLWDCIPRLDIATEQIIRALGGLKAIAISHPHYYSTMIEWSRAFGDPPIYLHADDREWVVRPDRAIEFWEGETLALPVGVAGDLTLVRCGGHFPGGTVLHWAGGAENRGAVLTGDVIQVLAAGRGLSFMFSYPNLIPLSGAAVKRIEKALRPFAFARVYGAFWDRTVTANGKSLLRSTVGQYVAALGA